ncbi:ATP-binding protein [Streptomyces chryseus]|uniref:ATP-binding protein n=1 Tax=Streptomyces chryseus TaxID=68186 RepID=A0ABQ3EBE3_9ACTN|nr:ATP-binding protein [Streptomyces chryseus]GHB32476.1 ATP-binding protein [Streptomyces chryseus]
MTLARPTTHATGLPAYTETFPALPESVRKARRLVALAVSTWGLEYLADDAALITSELATNAVQHTRVANFRVTVVRLQAGRVRVAVIDTRKGTVPEPHLAEPDAEHGRGLAIVAALSHTTGQDPLNWGKRMWADIEDKAPTPVDDESGRDL